MGVYQQSNAFTSGGLLTLRTQYANGAWSSAGMSSGDFYSASGGSLGDPREVPGRQGHRLRLPAVAR